MFHNSVEKSGQKRKSQAADSVEEQKHLTSNSYEKALGSLNHKINDTEAKIQALTSAIDKIKEKLAQFILEYDQICNKINEKKELAIKQVDSQFQQAYRQGFSEGFIQHYNQIGIEVNDYEMMLLLRHFSDQQLLNHMDEAYKKTQKVVKGIAKDKIDMAEQSEYKKLEMLVENYNKAEKNLELILSEKAVATCTLETLLNEYNKIKEELREIENAHLNFPSVGQFFPNLFNHPLLTASVPLSRSGTNGTPSKKTVI